MKLHVFKREYLKAWILIGGVILWVFLANVMQPEGPDKVSVFKDRADCGDVEAMFSLGTCYFYGDGVATNKLLGLEWWRKAADKGHESAMYSLGNCFMEGDGVERDLIIAKRLFLKVSSCERCRGSRVSYSALQKTWQIDKLLPTAEEFNGVKFGSDVREYGNVSLHDNSRDRGFLRSSGSYSLSYCSAAYFPKQVFRTFREGMIHASWASKKVYEVCYDASLDRNKTTAVDREELRQTIKALCRKYGDPVKSEGVEDGSRDCVYEWSKGDLAIRLKYVSEGLIVGSYMTLTAWSIREEAKAKRESLSYFNQRMAEEGRRFQLVVRMHYNNRRLI